MPGAPLPPLLTHLLSGPPQTPPSDCNNCAHLWAGPAPGSRVLESVSCISAHQCSHKYSADARLGDSCPPAKPLFQGPTLSSQGRSYRCDSPLVLKALWAPLLLGIRPQLQRASPGLARSPARSRSLSIMESFLPRVSSHAAASPSHPRSPAVLSPPPEPPKASRLHRLGFSQPVCHASAAQCY